MLSKVSPLTLTLDFVSAFQLPVYELIKQFRLVLTFIHNVLLKVLFLISYCTDIVIPRFLKFIP